MSKKTSPFKNETTVDIVREIETRLCQNAHFSKAYMKELVRRLKATYYRELTLLTAASNIDFSDGSGRHHIQVGWIKKGGSLI